MRIHYFQHVEFEGLGQIESHLLARHCSVSSTRWYAGEVAPAPENYDLLIVMGGPMGVYDYDQNPWLKDEKQAIKTAIDAGKKVLGVCLGAQLIADVLGASVSKNIEREIGWFEVVCSDALRGSNWAEVFPGKFTPLHWHGDTFSLPDNALLLGSSEACENQGFIVDDRIVALQFHLELSAENVAGLCVACVDELDGGRYVQAPAQMLQNEQKFSAVKPLLKRLLDVLLS